MAFASTDEERRRLLPRRTNRLALFLRASCVCVCVCVCLCVCVNCECELCAGAGGIQTSWGERPKETLDTTVDLLYLPPLLETDLAHPPPSQRKPNK